MCLVLTEYDLYDLHAIFVNIRFNPKCEINCEVITSVIKVLENRNNDKTNQFREELRRIDSLKDIGLYNFIIVDNKYTYYKMFLKDERIYDILLCACKELLQVIEKGNERQIIDLADCIHNLPIFIVEFGNRIPRKFLRREVTSYRRKWDKNFMGNVFKRCIL